jgi:hypothetical protein
MFRKLAAFQPPPPEGAGGPLQWGREEYVESRLGGDFDLEFSEHVSVYEAESAEAAWQEFVRAFGPLKTLHASLEPDRREELHRMMVEFTDRYRDGDGIRQPRTYLLVHGLRR